MIKLQHHYLWLWKESRLLDDLLRDKYGYLQPLATYINELRPAAKKLTKRFSVVGQAEHDTYADYFGWLGEVLCEFWLKKFGHRYDLCGIGDTSDNKFNRGFDLTARSLFSEELVSQIQVKMRGREDARFSAKDLFTFMNEGAMANVLPAYLVLMVPTCTLKPEELLSYRDEFNKLGWKRFRIITGPCMQRDIDLLPSAAGRSGNEEFLLQFREAVLTG